MPLSISETIKQAHDATEHRVKQEKFDLRLELILGIQEFLHENRFWWARKTARFTTEANVATYDLTSNAIANAPDVEEVIAVYRVDNSANPSEMTPILADADQIIAIENMVAAPPSAWMKEPGTWNTLRLGAPADGVYPIRLLYHAGVDTGSSDPAEPIPLIPAPLHYGAVIILKRRILDFLYGQKDPRYLTANMQYNIFVKNASRKSSFSAQHMRTFSSGDAVQAYG